MRAARKAGRAIGSAEQGIGNVVEREARKDMRWLSGKGGRSVDRKMGGTILIAGIVGIVMGLVAVFWPGAALELLIIVFGAAAILLGLMWMIQGMGSMGKSKLWWLLSLLGIAAVIAGVVVLVNQGAAMALFGTILTLYIFAQAIGDFVVGSLHGGAAKMVWFLMGALGVVMGFIIMLNPLHVSQAFVWLFGMYVLIRGMVALGYYMMHHHKR